MANQPHRIQQQLITLDWVDVAEPRQLEDQLARFARQQLLPQMESVFDEVTRDGQVIKFDKVVINLGDLYSTNWQKAFCTGFVTQLQQHLFQRTNDTQVQDARTEDDFQGAEILFKQFLFFINHGRLPWWGARQAAAALREAVSRFSPVQWRVLGDVIDKDDQARRRLIVFCEDEHLEQCFSAVYALNHLARIVMFFVSIPSDDTLFQAWRYYCWSRLFQVAAAEQQAKVLMKCLRELFVLRTVVGAGSKGGRRVLKLFQQDEQLRQAIATLPEPWRTWIDSLLEVDHQWEVDERNKERLLRRLVAGESFDKLIRIMPRTEQDFKKPDEPSTLVEVSLVSEKEVTAVSKSIKNKVKTVESPINVAAAGADIIHPFLQELFREQSLLKENDFRSEECRHIAVHMLAYLAFGNLDIEEYDLLLPKLLCAMPWEHALLPWEIADEQRKGCDELLGAVLHHWSALKSQSVQFLRQQFFWCNGKLKTVDGGWRLTIKKRAQDILLDKLPWGVGVIQMVWMNGTLHVTW